MRLVGDTIEYCAEHAPKYSPVSVCGYHIRESGADPAQEMAYAFCIAKAYIDHVLARGLDIDEFAGAAVLQLRHPRQPLRAGREVPRRPRPVGEDRQGASTARRTRARCWLRMIAGGGGGGLTIEQPENNIVRGAYYALVAALSGTQTMALCSYDEAYTIPTEHAPRISLRTMQILIEEMGLCDTVDPLGGSYFVETLTNEMESKIDRDHGRGRRRGRHRQGRRRGRDPGRGLARRPTSMQQRARSGRDSARSASTAIPTSTRRHPRSTFTATTRRARWSRSAR